MDKNLEKAKSSIRWAAAIIAILLTIAAGIKFLKSSDNNQKKDLCSWSEKTILGPGTPVNIPGSEQCWFGPIVVQGGLNPWYYVDSGSAPWHELRFANGQKVRVEGHETKGEMPAKGSSALAEFYYRGPQGAKVTLLSK